MKLYATTTSERASKGQGGNKKLEIDIQVGDFRQCLAFLEVERIYLNDKINGEREQYTLKLLNRDNKSYKVVTEIIVPTKGKLTKYCTNCQERTFGTGFEEGLCDKCWDKKQKGKQKKDEIQRCENCGARGHTATGCSYIKDAFR